MTLYLTDKNTFGELFGAVQLAIPFRIRIENAKQHERKPCDRQEQGGHSRE